MIDYGKWAFGNKKLVYFLIAVLLVGGVLSAYDMSKLEDPQITVKQAMVVAVCPGASAHEMELEVVDPLEKSIRTLGDVDIVTSWSMNDLGLIQVELKTTTPESAVEQCWDLLRRRVQNVQGALPQGTTVSVQDDFGLVYGMLYALEGDGLSERELADYADLIQREVGNLESVARVMVYGRREECINISMVPEKMATLGVSPAEVISTLEGQNEVCYAGYYDNGTDRVRVSVSDKFRSVERMEQMIIQGHEEDQLRLGDIALVGNGYARPVRGEMTWNGRHALGIAIAAAPGSDIVKVGAEVERMLAQLEAERFPAGVACHKIFYQPERVTDALMTFLINLLESVLIVVGILMLTMGFRSGMIIGISLVVTVLSSFLLLRLADGTMQRVSLASFILAMGMLVDNAIVIVDGILIDLKCGRPRAEALTAIGRKTAMPLLGATMIAILAFFPVFLSPDTAGVYIRDLFIVLAVSLLLSWIVALVHVPLMADRWFRKEMFRQPEGQQAALYQGRIYDALRSLLHFGLRHRIGSLLTAVVLVALSAWGYRYMKQGFFPDMVYDQLYMEYKLPEGTNSTRVAEDLSEIRAWLAARPEIRDITASVGGTPARYNLVRSIAIPSLSYGELIIDFESPEALDRNIDEIQRELSARYPDAYLKLKRYNLMFKKYPIEAQFTGPDPAVLHELSARAREIMEQSDRVCLITTDWDPAVPVLEVDYDQATARRRGLSRKNVAVSMLTASGGIPIGTFYDGVHKKTIYVQCSEEDGTAIDNLEDVPVFTLLPHLDALLDDETLLKLRTGRLDRGELVSTALSTVPLKQVSRGVKVGWEDPVIPRYNGQRAQRVMCSPAPGVETEAARQAIAGAIEAIELPAGYTFSWEGERKASTQTMFYLFKNIPVGIVLILLVLIMLFKGYRKPLVICCGIPLLAVGIVAAMLLTGKVFTFCAVVGALGLVGMMMKNCIVLLDEIDAEIEAGKEPSEALVNSAVSRLRPVMMASLTTILGMIPLLGDAMFGPLAATIMGGLCFSTFATLFFVPVLYALFFRIKAVK